MEALFTDFAPVSAKEWKQKIQFELNGADYNETLIWNAPDAIKVKPFYNKEEVKKNISVATEASKFKICQPIFVHDLHKSIQRALDSLDRGADSICFVIENQTTDVAQLLEKLPLENTPIFFSLGFLSPDFIEKIDTIATARKATIFCKLDPIGQLAKEGNWFSTAEKTNFDSLLVLSKKTKSISLISINGALYQNAGATIVQQIAYSLAHANEYFNRIACREQTMVFEMAIGSNYFFEIAKLRAIRLLFDLIAKEYQTNWTFHLLAKPSKRNKTLYDYNLNMLRTTTEYMSAILGGADSIASLAHNSLHRKDNEFGDRIARNQLLILKSESYFDKVNNPSDGSYYIESLTEQLAEKALVLFKKIEADGGFLKQLNLGNIKNKIQESATKEQDLFDAGKEILIGTNKHLDKNEQMKNELTLFPFLKIKARKTLIKPIIEKRLSEKTEQERLKKES